MRFAKFHFLNVGHGDCTFVELPSGRLMMVDINNSVSLPDDDVNALAASHNLDPGDFVTRGSYRIGQSWEDYYESLLVDPHDYYSQFFPGRRVFRYIQTHPDMDHMSGLHRFFWQGEIGLENFWDTAHTREHDEEEFKNSRYSYIDWQVYRLLRGGSGPKDSTHKVLTHHRHAAGSYWSDDSIEILSPTPELVADCNIKGQVNDLSYVLKLSFGGRSVILAGDAEGSAWGAMAAELPAGKLDCDILKAAHHGRDSGHHAGALELMDPHMVICSVGKKPHTDASHKYKAQGAEVFSTRSRGSLTATLWEDGEVWLHNAAGEQIGELPPL
jgi:competence protein ComEC